MVNQKKNSIHLQCAFFYWGICFKSDFIFSNVKWFAYLIFSWEFALSLQLQHNWLNDRLIWDLINWFSRKKNYRPGSIQSENQGKWLNTYWYSVSSPGNQNDSIVTDFFFLALSHSSLLSDKQKPGFLFDFNWIGKQIKKK